MSGIVVLIAGVCVRFFDGITRRQSGLIQFCDGLAGKLLRSAGSSGGLCGATLPDANCYISHLYAEHPRWHTELFRENYRGRKADRKESRDFASCVHYGGGRGSYREEMTFSELC